MFRNYLYNDLLCFRDRILDANFILESWIKYVKSLKINRKQIQSIEMRYEWINEIHEVIESKIKVKGKFLKVYQKYIELP